MEAVTPQSGHKTTTASIDGTNRYANGHDVQQGKIIAKDLGKGGDGLTSGKIMIIAGESNCERKQEIASQAATTLANPYY